MNRIVYFFIIVIFSSLISCNQIGDLSRLTKKNNIEINPIDTVLYQNETTITFRDTLIDLGDIKEGTKAKIVYHFTNTGSFPLIIKSVKPSCGCTIAEFSHKPIAPNVSDSITANFDSDGRPGRHQKSIQINTNSNPMLRDVVFKVNVIK